MQRALIVVLPVTVLQQNKALNGIILTIDHPVDLFASFDDFCHPRNILELLLQVPLSVLLGTLALQSVNFVTVLMVVLLLCCRIHNLEPVIGRHACSEVVVRIVVIVELKP